MINWKESGLKILFSAVYIYIAGWMIVHILPDLWPDPLINSGQNASYLITVTILLVSVIGMWRSSIRYVWLGAVPIVVWLLVATLVALVPMRIGF
ncbi:MAG: hypothetical protein RLZZ283_343 [Candidatus Parcubacteria bacterium]|jgi:hypothetical protein